MGRLSTRCSFLAIQKLFLYFLGESRVRSGLGSNENWAVTLVANNFFIQNLMFVCSLSSFSGMRMPVLYIDPIVSSTPGRGPKFIYSSRKDLKQTHGQNRAYILPQFQAQIDHTLHFATNK